MAAASPGHAIGTAAAGAREDNNGPRDERE